MKELRFTKQFKKDLKRYLNQPKKLEELRGHFINFEGRWGGLRGVIFEG